MPYSASTKAFFVPRDEKASGERPRRHEAPDALLPGFRRVLRLRLLTRGKPETRECNVPRNGRGAGGHACALVGTDCFAIDFTFQQLVWKYGRRLGITVVVCATQRHVGYCGGVSAELELPLQLAV